MKKRVRKNIIIATIAILVIASITITTVILNSESKKIGGYIIFYDKLCDCEIGKKHTDMQLAFNYNSEKNILSVEFLCHTCGVLLAQVDVSNSPAAVTAKTMTPYGNLEYIDFTAYAGNGSRIFEDIINLSGCSNIDYISYEKSNKTMKVYDIYEYGDWTKTILAALGTYVDDTYIITFDSNGASGIMEDKHMLSGQLPLCYYMKEGYLFDGWATEKNGSPIYEDQEYIELEDNITLYACWTENPYNIFVLSENSVHGIAKTTSLYGKLLTVSAKANTGYYFKGWYDEIGNFISSEEQYSVTLPDNDIYLIAHFAANNGSVYIIDGGADYKGDMAECVAGTKVNIYAGYKAGYDFAEWEVTKGDITLDSITSDQTSFTMLGDDIVLTAKWKEIKGISAEVNSSFNNIYHNDEYFNGIAYDIDKGIIIKSNMISVYVEFTDGTKKEIPDFVMETSTLKTIGGNSIPVMLNLNGSIYNTEVIIQCYSSSLMALISAAGIDIDAFQKLNVLISQIQSGLSYINNTLLMYQQQLDDLYLAYTSGTKDKTTTRNELSAIRLNMKSLANQCKTYESDISSVTQQARALILAYDGDDNKAVSEAFSALASQIKNLTSQVLSTCETQDFLLEKYESIKNTVN